jgi:uncharacterized NAD(P)/FAD-binding protein YdhS
MTISRTLAIVGGGFCGALCAVHLLRARPSGFNRITLIDAGPRIARGIAYSTAQPLHLLNVPAARMSAFADDSEHFLRFARTFDARISGADFLPRKLYGDYLENLLQETSNNLIGGAIEFQQLRDTVIDLEVQEGDRLQLTLLSGATLLADRIILALGNDAPRAPSIAGRRLTAAGPRYIDDPWSANALQAIDFKQDALLIGTGLTAVDVVTVLHEQGFRNTVHAVSRHGLLPLAHRGLSHAGRELQLPAQLLPSSNVKKFLHGLRTYIRVSANDEIDWRDVLAALRKETSRLWQNFNDDERARFLRHCQVYWDVHRHRLAPRIGALFTQLIAERGLQVRAARLIDFHAESAQLRIQLRNRHAQSEEWLTVGTVINCTGPSANIEYSSMPLWQSLLARGLVKRDRFGVGIAIADNYAVLDAAGIPSPAIYYVGPLLKADFWEATAVPELRMHVAKLCAGLTGGFAEQLF